MYIQMCQSLILKENMNNEQVKFLLNWNRFGDHLSSCMNRLLTDSSYSDIIIATADKQMIYSHRFVLANSSKYFQRLLKRINPNRGTQLVVALPEIKYDIFKILMNYMYKGVTQVPHELLPSVIRAGQFLEINGLMNLSEGESESSVSKTTNTPKVNSAEPAQQKCATVHPSSWKTPIPKESNKLFGPIPQNLLNKINSRENNSVAPKNSIQIESNKTKKPNDIVDNHSGDVVRVVENGKENHNKMSKPTMNKTNNDDKDDVIHLPLKRKAYSKEPVKKVPPLIISKSPTSTSSSSSSSSFVVIESPAAKKRREIIIGTEDTYEEVVITTEKKKPENASAEKENQEVPEIQEIQEINEIQEIQEIYERNPKKPEPQEPQKSQKPQKPQESQRSQDPPRQITKTVNIYSDSKCEFCHKSFAKRTDWVKHMAGKHADKGFKYFRDMQWASDNGPITCVMCSYVFVSREEYAKHINRKVCSQFERNKKGDGKPVKKSGVNEKN